jgi:hypothetical protein
MSSKLSLPELLERRGATQGADRRSSDSPATKFVLKASGPIYRPFPVIELLKKHGLPLKEAHSVMNRIAGREPVFVEIDTSFPRTLVTDLSRLGVAAYGYLLPIPLVKIGQDYQINSSSRVRYSYAL